MSSVSRKKTPKTADLTVTIKITYKTAELRVLKEDKTVYIEQWRASGRENGGAICVRPAGTGATTRALRRLRDKTGIELDSLSSLAEQATETLCELQFEHCEDVTEEKRLKERGLR